MILNLVSQISEGECMMNDDQMIIGCHLSACSGYRCPSTEVVKDRGGSHLCLGCVL